MRALSKIGVVLAWALFLLSVGVQALLMLTFTLGGEMIGKARAVNEVNARALPFVVVGTLLFAAGFLLFCFLRRGRWIWYAAAAVGAVILAGVGFYLKNAYPETIIPGGAIAGYDSAFKLVWRHMSPIAALVCGLLWRVFGHFADENRLRREAVQDIKDEGFTPRF